MESEPPESGFDELMCLSKQFKNQERESTQREKQRAEQRKKVQDVIGGLKELKVSMAIEQLKLVTTPEIIEEVDSLRHKQGTEELRKLISNLATNLEKSVGSASSSKADTVSIESSVKTLAILIELLFSLE